MYFEIPPAVSVSRPNGQYDDFLHCNSVTPVWLCMTAGLVAFFSRIDSLG